MTVSIVLLIMRSNNLIMRVPCYKKSRILKQPDLMEGEIIALLVPWRG